MKKLHGVVTLLGMLVLTQPAHSVDDPFGVDK